MKKPEFAVFVSCVEELELLARAGAERIYLNLPGLCARCFEPELKEPEVFKRLEELVVAGHSCGAKLSLNLDFLERDSDFDLVFRLLNLCRKNGLSSFRVQTSGLADFIRSRFSDAQIIFAPETGNLSSESIRFYQNALSFQMQTLSSLLSFEQIRSIKDSIQTNFELQVFGSVLLQQSARFLLSVSAQDKGAPVREPKILFEIGRETGGRCPRLKFAQNCFGTFVYSPSVLSLAVCFNRLCALDLKSWVFDGRLMDTRKITAALKHFTAMFKDYESGKRDGFTDVEDYADGEDMSTGFFMTGFVEQGKYLDTSEVQTEKSKQAKTVGRIIDVVNGQCALIELVPGAEVGAGQEVVFESPNRIKPKTHKLQWLKSVSGIEVDSVNGPGLVVCDWKKGLVPGTMVKIL